MLFKPPKKIAVAVSGGKDSMVVLDFLLKGGRDITVLHYNHGSEHAEQAESFVREHCVKNNLKLFVGKNVERPAKNMSKEDFWRKKRYEFFANVKNIPIVTAHHLNDAVETWLFTSLNGNPYTIPVKRDNFIRPFLITEQKVLDSWAEKKNVPWIDDPSNEDVSFRRNYIRHVLLPMALKVNPGLFKVVKKKYFEVL